MKELTQKQNRVLIFIKLCMESKGYQPSFQEIGDYLGIQPSAVNNHIKALERKGFLKRTGSHRSLTILDA